MKIFILGLSLLLFNAAVLAVPQQLLDSANSPHIVYFDFNRSELRAEALPVLDSIAAYMKNDKSLKLLIQGHTDNKGSYKFNLVLSQKRGDAVKSYLVSAGCPPELIVVEALSFSKPVSSNDFESGRSLNRRVNFYWIKPDKVHKRDLEVNASILPVSRDTIKLDLSVIDIDSTQYKDLKEEHITAALTWDNGTSEQTTKGKVNLISLDNRKKIAASLIMDYSPSMWDDKFEVDAAKSSEILAMEHAVKKFIDKMDSRIYARIIKFGGDIDPITEYTVNKYLLLDAVELRSFPRPATALFATIMKDLKDNPFSNDPAVMKSIIAFTDGEDNASYRITGKDVIKIAGQLGIRVFTIGLFPGQKHTDPPGLTNLAERDLFNIAVQTGAFYYYSPDAGSLESIYTSILNLIMNSYSVSIIWDKETLPPVGTPVKAVVKIKIRNEEKTLIKDYIML